MARLEATLASEIEALTPTTNAAGAVQTLADAYGVYMADAEANGVPIENVATGVAAMASAMSFPVPSTPAEAGTQLANGVSAFWAAMVAAPATFFPGATAITTPPALADLAPNLATVFAANVGRSLEGCAAALADAMDTASTGGTATFPGPVVAAIT